MNMKFVRVLFLILGGMLTGCGSSTATPETDTGKGAVADCKSAWTQYVAQHPLGKVEEFQTETKMRTGATERVLSSGRDTSRVTESNNEQVIVEVTSGGQTTPMKMTRAEMEKACDLAVPTNPQGPAPEVLERSRKTVTVPAGTFDCAYTKVKVSQMVVETWAEGDGRTGAVVKSVSTMPQRAGTEMITVRELVRRG